MPSLKIPRLTKKNFPPNSLKNVDENIYFIFEQKVTGVTEDKIQISPH